jgi:pimeloyl-ACP methyl ester carboxylesterase
VNERLERFSIAAAGGAGTLAVEVVARVSDGADATLLCLHGFGDNLQTWQGVTAMLGARGARVVAVDLPGFGRSALPAGFARAYVWNAAALAAAMAARWRRPDRPLFVAGNSLGGAIALALAAHVDAATPGAERPPDGLLLLAPATPGTRVPPFAHLTRFPFYRWTGEVQDRVSPRARRALGAVVGRATIRWILAPGAVPPRAWRDSVVAAFSRPGCFADLEGIARNVLWILRGKDAAALALHAEISRVSTPTVILHGDRDRVVSRAEVVDLSTRMPDARLVELPGVGHCPQIETPARCVEAYEELRARV